MKLKNLLVILAIAATISASAYVVPNYFKSNGKTVDVATISRQVISPSILSSGFLAHEEEVMLSSEVIGKVDELMIEEGDSVNAGDLVLRVDDKNFLAGLEQSEASVRINTIDIERQEVRISNLERQFARSSSLYEQDLIGEEEYESLRNQLDLARIDFSSSKERLTQAEAQLDQVLDNLSKTKIISPIDREDTRLERRV